MRQFALVALFALTTLIGTSLCPAGVLAADALQIEVQEDVQYGTGAGEPLHLDIARPIGMDAAAPGLVLIHGGGWMMGNKRSYKELIQRCAEEGYVTVSVGYRLAPKHRFPSQVEDSKCAVRWLRAHADDLGLDPDRIGAMGHSAGAHLSMMLGTMDTEDGMEGEGGWSDQSSKVQAVVSYFGPVDLAVLPEKVDDLAAGDVINITAVRRILQAAVGGPAEEHQDVLKLNSPLSYVTPGDAPTLMFQGTKDVLVPYDQAFWMAKALTDAKIPGRVELILGAPHGFVNSENERTFEMAMDFFAEHLGSK